LPQIYDRLESISDPSITTYKTAVATDADDVGTEEKRSSGLANT